MIMNETSAESNKYLIFGGLFSLAFAVFQVGGIFFSSDVVAYFGGPVELQLKDPVFFVLLCIIIGTIVAIAGLYALSGAGKLRPLPFLRTVLIIVTMVYLIRGLHIILDIISLFEHPGNLLYFVVFSFIAFYIGIIHLIGAIHLFKHSHHKRRTTQ